MADLLQNSQQARGAGLRALIATLETNEAPSSPVIPVINLPGFCRNPGGEPRLGGGVEAV